MKEEAKSKKESVEETLEKERILLRTLIENLPDHVYVKDTESRFIICNTAVAEFMGVATPDELIGKTDLDFYPKDEAEHFHSVEQEIIRTGKPLVIRDDLRRDLRGRDRWIATTRMPLRDSHGKIVGTVGIGHDVTERKEAEDALRDSEERYKMFSEITLEGIAFHDRGKLIDINSSFARIFGYETAELIGKNVMDILTLPEYRAIIREKIAASDNKPYEIMAKRKNGTVFPLEIEAREVRYRGSVIQVISVRDITERKITEEALYHERYLLNTLMDNIPDSIYFKDDKSRFIRINRACADRFGLSDPSKAVGKTDYDFFTEEHAGPAFENEIEIMKTGMPLIGLEERETFYDGREKWVSTTKMPLKNKEGKIIGTFGISRDITEHKQAEEALRESEEQLRQSQKIEAVGRLAGGIAHDFNNILTAIIGYSDFILMKSKPDKLFTHYIEQIKLAAERAASLTNQLLSFSRKQMLRPKVLNLNELISRLEIMLARLIGEDIYLHINLDDNLGLIRADPGQIEQVIMNLAVNSRDAMPDGGKIMIETRNVNIDEGFRSRYDDPPPGDYILLAVSDTGHGMDEDTRERLFEPFFTTKDVGKGTGLGLSTVYGIVKQSGGHIQVTSEVDRGTAFKIYIPRIGGDDDIKRGTARSEKSERGYETVLLVEDEDAVRNIISVVLKEYGYTIHVAQNGEEALQICEQLGDRSIDLMITDVVMPGMSGRKLSERIVQMCPGIKVMYISGYTDDAIVGQDIFKEGVCFLQKPFTPKGLTRKVREALDRET